jgi:hypothetical protein
VRPSQPIVTRVIVIKRVERVERRREMGLKLSVAVRGGRDRVEWENRETIVGCIYCSDSLSTMGIVVLYILQNGRKENSAICHYSYLRCHLSSRTYSTRNQAHHDT